MERDSGGQGWSALGALRYRHTAFCLLSVCTLHALWVHTQDSVRMKQRGERRKAACKEDRTGGNEMDALCTKAGGSCMSPGSFMLSLKMAAGVLKVVLNSVTRWKYLTRFLLNIKSSMN